MPNDLYHIYIAANVPARFEAFKAFTGPVYNDKVVKSDVTATDNAETYRLLADLAWVRHPSSTSQVA